MGTGEYMDTAKRQDIRDIEQYGHCKSRISICKFMADTLRICSRGILNPPSS
jgi:hypothetical protein